MCHEHFWQPRISSCAALRQVPSSRVPRRSPVTILPPPLVAMSPCFSARASAHPVEDPRCRPQWNTAHRMHSLRRTRSGTPPSTGPRSDLAAQRSGSRCCTPNDHILQLELNTNAAVTAPTTTSAACIRNDSQPVSVPCIKDIHFYCSKTGPA